jgi:hypothetical protein
MRSLKRFERKGPLTVRSRKLCRYYGGGAGRAHGNPRFRSILIQQLAGTYSGPGRPATSVRSPIPAQNDRASTWVNLLITESISNVVNEILAFRIGREELGIIFRRKLEIVVDFAASKSQIQQTFASAERGRIEDTQLHSQPLHCAAVRHG